MEIRFLGKYPNVNFTLEFPITNVALGSLVSDEIATRVAVHCKKKGINIDRVQRTNKAPNTEINRA